MFQGIYEPGSLPIVVSPATGVITGASVSRNGGAFAAGLGVFTNMGGGYYSYAFTNAETQSPGVVVVKFNGAAPEAVVAIQIRSLTMDLTRAVQKTTTQNGLNPINNTLDSINASLKTIVSQILPIMYNLQRGGKT